MVPASARAGRAGCGTLDAVRILVDYRPALRERTGVGEYVHELVRACAREAAGRGDRVAIFTSSWRDRPAPGLGAELGADVIDRRVPVRVLNYLWHRLGWPPVELFAGSVDVVHAAHPLLIPARGAAQVVTIHDLFFLTRPGGSRAEIRRDYPRLAAPHARKADAVITSTQYGATLVSERLGVDPARIHICSPGAPTWRSLGREPNVPREGYVLFVGTLEPRKNIGVLLDAFELVVQRIAHARLVLAGRPTPDAGGWLDRLRRPPLVGRVEHRGYVPIELRESLYAGARVLVLPSLDEGFGLPALEAMSAGVPVVASNRGALPEVLGGAGTLVDATDVGGFARALERLLTDDSCANAAAGAGLRRARDFSWSQSAAHLRRAYVEAVAHRRLRDAHRH